MPFLGFFALEIVGKEGFVDGSLYFLNLGFESGIFFFEATDEFALGEGIGEVVLFLLFVEEERRAEELVVHQLYYDNFI